jgi:lactoylglutathione lyase
MSHSPPSLGDIIVDAPGVGGAAALDKRTFGAHLRSLSPSRPHAEVDVGATALAFANEAYTPSREACEPNRPERRAASAEVAFVVEDVPMSVELPLRARCATEETP